MGDWHQILGDIKEWQTGIGALLGALLGLVALMVAAQRNFSLNRKRDLEVRDGEMRSVASALYGEIILLRKELARLSRMIARDVLRGGPEYPRHFIEINTPSEPTVFPVLVGKIGILPADVALGVIRFYAHFSEAKKSLPFLIDSSDGGPGYSSSAVLKDAVEGVKGVSATLRRIEEIVCISAAESPDLGNAEGVLDFLEAQSADGGSL